MFDQKTPRASGRRELGESRAIKEIVFFNPREKCAFVGKPNISKNKANSLRSVLSKYLISKEKGASFPLGDKLKVKINDTRVSLVFPDNSEMNAEELRRRLNIYELENPIKLCSYAPVLEEVEKDNVVETSPVYFDPIKGRAYFISSKNDVFLFCANCSYSFRSKTTSQSVPITQQIKPSYSKETGIVYLTLADQRENISREEWVSALNCYGLKFSHDRVLLPEELEPKNPLKRVKAREATLKNKRYHPYEKGEHDPRHSSPDISSVEGGDGELLEAAAPVEKAAAAPVEEAAAASAAVGKNLVPDGLFDEQGAVTQSPMDIPFFSGSSMFSAEWRDAMLRVVSAQADDGLLGLDSALPLLDLLPSDLASTAFGDDIGIGNQQKPPRINSGGKPESYCQEMGLQVARAGLGKK
jgi:hypothetical protein